jgi:hypothetical protein
MTVTEIALKSPSVTLVSGPHTPFSKGEFFPVRSNPSLEKHALSVVEGRGRGDFGRNEVGELCGEFLTQDTSSGRRPAMRPKQ